MSIFGSLLGAIPSAARWLIGNSGVIGDAVGTIGKIAGLVTVQDEDGTFIFVPEANSLSGCDCPEGGHSVQDIQSSMIKAGKVLDEVAAKVPRAEEPGDPTTAKMNVLWTEPSTSVNGAPSKNMYKDLAMMLREKNIPLSFSDSAGNPVDVPFRLAQGLFSNAKTSGTVYHIDENTDIQHTDIRIPSRHNECVINARHAWYKVPMGKGGDDDAWHASVCVVKNETPEFAARYKKQQESLFYISKANPPSGPVWIVTCEIDWGTVLMAENAHGRLDAELRESANYYISYSNVEANLQIIKVVANSETSPQQIRTRVEVAVNKVIKAVSNQAMNLLDSTSAYPAGPEGTVKITTQEFLGSYEATSDYRMAVRRLATESAKASAKRKKEMEPIVGLPVRKGM